MKFYCVNHKYSNGYVKIAVFVEKSRYKPANTVSANFDEFWDYFRTRKAAEAFAAELKSLYKKEVKKK